MKVYKITSRKGVFFTTAQRIGEAHAFARKELGPGVSFSVQEATIEEATAWLNSE